MSWRVAGTVAGTIVVLSLALAGYLLWRSYGTLDAGLVASHVKTFEGENVEVKSCEKVASEAITNDDYGASLDEVWRCDASLKHSFISGHAERDTPVVLVADLVGHSRVTTTQTHYTRVRGGERQRLESLRSVL
jgi:hypothetical protein